MLTPPVTRSCSVYLRSISVAGGELSWRNARPFTTVQSPTSLQRRARALSAIVLGLFAVGATASAASPSRWETLEAIHRVENPHNSTKPGPQGELGAYQFRLETWRHYTSTPFRNAL